MTVFWELHIEENVPACGTVVVLANKTKEDARREFTISQCLQSSLQEFSRVKAKTEHVVVNRDYTRSQIVAIITRAMRDKDHDLVFVSNDKSNINDFKALLQILTDFAGDEIVFIGGGYHYVKSSDVDLTFVESYN